MIARDQLLGAISVQSFQPGVFGDADLRYLESSASQIASAIENADLVESLREQTLVLEQRNEELDAFAHTVAHDLKSLLARVVGLSELMAEEIDILAKEEMTRHLESVSRSGRKMSRITDELLLLAGVRQLGAAEFTVLQMDEIVAETLVRLEDMIRDHQAEIVIPDTWPTALGYGAWVEEVWYNLVSNAIQYGGDPPRVELGATEQIDGTVCFWVRDNGAGLTREEQARLFTPFPRVGETRSEGCGLGLSIVRRVVEKLGGQVDVESTVGEGSVFGFTLALQ